MQLELTKHDDRLVARLIGELDHHAAAEVRERIDNAVLQQRCRRLTLDFSGLTFMDSSGIGLIMGRYRLMHSCGGTLQIENASQRLETVIRLAGLEKLPIWDETERKKTHETCQ
ncbi:MAG: anti-sigma factor antagonist [Clostridia bacterium]|nr:anti-sigma factor antagonist [Clostridia bacterium]